MFRRLLRNLQGKLFCTLKITVVFSDCNFYAVNQKAMFVSALNCIKLLNDVIAKCDNNFEHIKKVFPKDGAISAEICRRKCDN
jgi:hypothetical protein